MSKFADATCEALHDLSMDGCLEGECGSVAENGEWYGLLLNTDIKDARRAILREDSQGFVTYEVFEMEYEAREAFERIEADIASEMSDE